VGMGVVMVSLVRRSGRCWRIVATRLESSEIEIRSGWGCCHEAGSAGTCLFVCPTKTAL